MSSVVSIQSAVAYGYVGNSAAVFALQRLGVTVWPINTVTLANHVGYPSVRGRQSQPEEVSELLLGLGERGALDSLDAVLVGYLGSAGVAEVVARWLVERPAGGAFVCDPVLGDNGRRYVSAEVAEVLQERILPHADVLTPNFFELCYLSGTSPATLAEVVVLARHLVAGGVRTVVVTSVPDAIVGPWADPSVRASGGRCLGTLVVDQERAWLCITPEIAGQPSGSGDVFAALWTAHWCRGESTAQATALAVSSVYALVADRHQRGRQELDLVGRQHELVEPAQMFPALELARL